MFAPLNGAPLNGSAGDLWATAVVDATAVCLSEYRVYSSAVATVIAEADTDSASVRLSFFEGGKLAASLIDMASVRYAYLEGANESEALESIEVKRTAWAKAQPLLSGINDTDIVLNRIYSDAKATGIGESTKSIDPVRTAYFDGNVAGSAVDIINPVRNAHMSGLPIEGQASEEIVPVRTAWFYADAAVSESTLSGTAFRWKILTGNAYTGVSSTLDKESITVYRGAVGKKLPGVSLTWGAESKIQKLRVRQVDAKANALCRSFVRCLPNTELGFSTVIAEALDNNVLLKTNKIVSPESMVLCEAGTEILTSKVRITEAGIVGKAESVSAPTITTSTGRFSYNSGLSVGSVVSSDVNMKVFKFAVTFNQSGVSSFTDGKNFLNVKATSKVQSFADIKMASKNNNHKKAVSIVEGKSLFNADVRLYKWGSIVAPAVYGEAVSSCYNSISVSASSGLEKANAESNSTNVRIAYDERLVNIGDSFALGEATKVQEAVSLVTGRSETISNSVHTTYGLGLLLAHSATSIFVDRNALLDAATIRGSATTTGVPLRTTTAKAYSMTSVGSIAVSSTRFAKLTSTLTTNAELIGTSNKLHPVNVEGSITGLSSSSIERMGFIDGAALSEVRAVSSGETTKTTEENLVGLLGDSVSNGISIRTVNVLDDVVSSESVSTSDVYKVVGFELDVYGASTAAADAIKLRSVITEASTYAESTVISVGRKQAYTSSTAIGKASETTTGKRIAWVAGTSISDGLTVSVGSRKTAWQKPATYINESVSNSTNNKRAVITDSQLISQSNVGLDTTTYGMVNVEPTYSVGVASVLGQGLRAVVLTSKDSEGVAVEGSFVYQINIDGLADEDNTLYIEAASRELSITYTDREYII